MRIYVRDLMEKSNLQSQQESKEVWFSSFYYNQIEHNIPFSSILWTPFLVHLSLIFPKWFKESGSTWDVDAKLPKFAENASHEFETIVSLMAKVFTMLGFLYNVEISHVCRFILKANFFFYK